MYDSKGYMAHDKGTFYHRGASLWNIAQAIYQYVFLPSHPPYPSRWVSTRKLCIWLGYQPLTLVNLNVYNMADFVEKITTDRYTQLLWFKMLLDVQ